MRLECSFAPRSPARTAHGLLALLAAACGPRAGSEAGDASVTRDFGIGASPDRPPGLVCERVVSLPFRPRPAEVLVVFDRSESMNLEFGDRTRYEVAADLLADLLPAYDDKIRFGFEPFPAKLGCASDAVTGCCVEPPAVPVAPAASGEILAALQAAAPASGNTPTALALRTAHEHFSALDDGVPARYVLLSTDGVPSCTVEGKLPPAGDGGAAACTQALAEVDALVADKVKVIVLGLGADLVGDPTGAPACLTALAKEGGLERDDGGPALFLASDHDALAAALEQIFGAVGRPSCLIDLESEAADPAQVRVRFDGREIPRGRKNGWDYDPPTQAQHLQVYGEPCRRLERFQVVKVEVEFGCTPCQEDRPCE